MKQYRSHSGQMQGEIRVSPKMFTNKHRMPGWQAINEIKRRDRQARRLVRNSGIKRLRPRF